MSVWNMSLDGAAAACAASRSCAGRYAMGTSMELRSDAGRTYPSRCSTTLLSVRIARRRFASEGDIHLSSREIPMTKPSVVTTSLPVERKNAAAHSLSASDMPRTSPNG